MKKLSAFLSTIAIITLLLISASAHAGLFRAYLSSTGNDANACTLQAPCRLLPAALAAVSNGGEIWMLDSANYNTGPVNITKSVSILAIPGVVGSVLANGGDAIDIATVGVNVALRNLVIVALSQNATDIGINMTAGAALSVESCIIANLYDGIRVTTAARVYITDTTIRNSFSHGMLLQDGVNATVAHSILRDGSYGILIQGVAPNTTTTVDIADTTIAGNVRGGVFVNSQTVSAAVFASIRDSRLVSNSGGAGAIAYVNTPIQLTVSNSNVSNNKGTGIYSWGTGAIVLVSGNTISNNGYDSGNPGQGQGIATYYGGIVKSAGNNTISNNRLDVSGSLTLTATQ